MTHHWLLRTCLWFRKSSTPTSPKCAMASEFKFMPTIPAVTLVTGPSTKKRVKATWHTKMALNTEVRWLTVCTTASAFTFGLPKHQTAMKSPKKRLATFTSEVGSSAWCMELAVFNIKMDLYSSHYSATTWLSCQAATISQTLSWPRSNKETIQIAYNNDILMRRMRKSPNATRQICTESKVPKSSVTLLMKSE